MGTFADAVRAGPKVRRRSGSLSAFTFMVTAETSGFPLTRHNVFFCRHYPREFQDIFRDYRTPDEPTVYVCAQDRGEPDAAEVSGAERLLLLVNAPETGMHRKIAETEMDQCQHRMHRLLARLGLTMTITQQAVTRPSDFAALFPASNGSLYGRALHSSMAAFQRPGARSKLPGLYLAGGSVHPGPGVPMATLSGRQAASSVLRDLISR